MPADTMFLCLTEYGLAVGAANTTAYSGYSPGPGAPGVAVALYRSQTEPCPPTSYR